MSTLVEPAAAGSPARAAASSPRGPAACVRRLAGLREIALIAALWVVYSASRLVADDDLDDARRRGAALLDVERYLHLDVEWWLNHALTPHLAIAVVMSFWYASLHYVVTPAVLAFLYFRHRELYARARNAIVIGSALGLVCYVLVPTAPPRLMAGSRYVDALTETSRYGWWSDHASAPAGFGHLTNELAAMPSLHVGWTIWVAWALWRHTNVVGRAVACAYAAGTTLVVLATGNHWLLDAVGGAVVITVGIVLATRVDAYRAGRGARSPDDEPATAA